ncbi:hypothetical protein K490DRAFT_19114, partial [Saccharata proteae CBS 121410]
SPTSTTPKLGSKRGRITAIACVPCKKRKSKCNGLQPVCNTCAMKGSTCSYDMRQEHRWQGTLRVNVKKLEQELEEIKAVLPLLATTPQRDAAMQLALEIRNNGFSEHSAEEVKNILRGLGRASSTVSSEDPAPAVESPQEDMMHGGSGQESMPVNSKSQVSGSSHSFGQVHGVSFRAPNSAGSIPPISYICAAFRESKRQLLADGFSPVKIFGSNENDIAATIGNDMDFQIDQPLSVWAPRITNVFMSNVSLAEKLACAEVVKGLMQWQICPSRQNLERLPEWSRPTEAQMVTPHDPLIDYLPWPSVREYFLHHPEYHVAGSLNGLICVNWTYDDSSMFYRDPNSGVCVLSPAFREHIRDLNNWTMTPEGLEQMPFLMGRVP